MSTQRRLLTVLVAVALCLVVVVLVLQTPPAPNIQLGTGESVEFYGATVGTGFPVPTPSPARELIDQWAVRLGRSKIFDQPTGAGSSSWTSWIPREQALNTWLDCPKGFGLDRDQGNNRHHAGITTEEGWLCLPMGIGFDRAAGVTNQERCVLAFTYYPRWNKEVTLRFYRNDTKTSVGEMRIPNADFQAQPRHNWTAQSLPQTTRVSGVEFTLKGLKWHPDWRSRDPARANDPFKFPPVIEPQVEVDQPGVSNRWQRVWTLVEDNYGNVWNTGLPPRVAGKSTGPRTIWRIRMWYCATGPSIGASNAYHLIPKLSVPPPMQAAVLPLTNFTIGTASGVLCGVAGSAFVTYSNNVLVAMNPSRVQGLGISQSSSTYYNGTNENQVQSVDASVPHVALRLHSQHSSPELYYSLLASNPATGDRRFLSTYMRPQQSPDFGSFSSKSAFALGQLGDVLTNWTAFDLIVGIHPALVVDFWIDQPEVSAQMMK